jgi:membrane fusion protein, multidrug efflux system
MKRWIKWGIVALVIALLAAGILRALSARKAQQQALATQTAQGAQTVVELAPTDVVQVKTRELAQGLAISGALKAVNSAVIKARVAGELQALTVREGDRVQAGQVIARVDPTEYQARLKQAQEQADAARTQIEIAQRQFDNNRALVDQGFISKTALDTSSSTLLGAQATYKAAMAAVDVAKKSLDDTVLRSPLNGLVSQRLAQPGERVAIDARVIEVLDLSAIELEATLSATESLSVKVGQQASLQIEGANAPFTAKVVRISPSTQAGGRSVLAYLRIDKPAGLRQGLFAQGTLGTGRSSGMAVPLNAVRTDKPEPYIQIVENSQVVHQAVELAARGEADGEPMVLLKGLPENTLVISGLVGPLRAGTAVRFTQPVASAASAPAATASNVQTAR